MKQRLKNILSYLFIIALVWQTLGVLRPSFNEVQIGPESVSASGLVVEVESANAQTVAEVAVLKQSFGNCVWSGDNDLQIQGSVAKIGKQSVNCLVNNQNLAVVEFPHNTWSKPSVLSSNPTWEAVTLVMNIKNSETDKTFTKNLTLDNDTTQTAALVAIEHNHSKIQLLSEQAQLSFTAPDTSVNNSNSHYGRNIVMRC